MAGKGNLGTEKKRELRGNKEEREGRGRKNVQR